MSKRITIAEACRLAGGDDHPVDRSTIHRWVKAGRISPPVRTGPRVVRFDRDKLARELGLEVA
jgi:predicted site-specific integrase-resolvase